MIKEEGEIELLFNWRQLGEQSGGGGLDQSVGYGGRYDRDRKYHHSDPEDEALEQGRGEDNILPISPDPRDQDTEGSRSNLPQ